MRRQSSIGPLRILAAVLIFASPALWESLHGSALSGINGGDFWWHLRTGLEILRTHSLPHTGWFSQSATMPWIASSWLYDIKIAIWYQWLGLRFLPLLALIAKFLLALLTFLLAGGLRGRFWTALTLSAIAQFVLWQLPPLPVFWSALAFAVELMLLREARRGSLRALYFVPLLFFAWANFDPQFVYGALALLLFLTASTVEERYGGVASRGTAGNPIATSKLLAIGAASIIATWLTPYGWGPWGVFWANASSAANRYFPDYQSLRFRTPQDYVLLLLAMAAFLSLGLRRSRDGFQIALLVLCTMAAFHAQRDAWLLVVASVAVIGNPVPEDAASRETQAASFEPRSFLAAAGISVVFLLVVITARLPRQDAVLARVAESYPVAASNYIRRHQLPGPMFNSFPWGGFLTWYLPQYPVAVDGRTDLYGSDFNAHYAKAMNFEEHYSTFAPLSEASLILLEKNSHMAIALESVPAYKTAYSDDVAVVLVRDQGQP